jgi:hypothetical protein
MGKVIVALIAIVIVVILATRLIDLDVTDKGKLPDVDVAVQEGRLPNVDADVGKVEGDSKDVTVEVPTVDIEPAQDDAEEDLEDPNDSNPGR